MAQFFGEVKGRSKEAASRIGTKTTGIEAHVRGWNVGVSIDGRHGSHQLGGCDVRGEGDSFTIAITGGSTAANERRWIGTVQLENGVRRFYPADWLMREIRAGREVVEVLS